MTKIYRTARVVECGYYDLFSADEEVAQATTEELPALTGVTREQAETVMRWLAVVSEGPVKMILMEGGDDDPVLMLTAG